MTTQINQAEVETMMAAMLEGPESTVSAGRLRAMQRQMVAWVAGGGDHEEMYRMARAIRRAEISA